jgi:hypothetical protein
VGIRAAYWSCQGRSSAPAADGAATGNTEVLRGRIRTEHRLFVVYAAVGLAVLTLLHVRRHPLQKLLLAPGVGIGVSAWSSSRSTRPGLPVAAFGPALLVSLLILTWAWRSAATATAAGHYSAFAGLILLGLLLTGGPIPALRL